MAFYRALLYLLPARERARHGEQMAIAFASLERRAGVFARVWLWLREVAGLLRFAARTRLGGWRAPGFGSGSEFRWAWRGVRARGWRGVMSVVLLALAIGGNAVVFSAADSFVLERTLYPEAERLVQVGRTGAFAWGASHALESIPAWRSFTDLFSAVYAYRWQASWYVTSGQGPRFVPAVAVEPGLLDLLGARPVAGRLFVRGDEHADPATLCVIAEDLAIEQFGSAQNALDQTITLSLGDVHARVVGVVSTGFRFDTGDVRVWTPFDPTVPLPYGGATLVFQMAAGQSRDAVENAVRAREDSVPQGASASYKRLKPLAPLDVRPLSPTEERIEQLFTLLVAASGCLLFIACANVLHLEWTHSLSRMRSHAIALALGATRGSLVRGALIEGLIMTSAAGAAGASLGALGLHLLRTELPNKLIVALTNPLDFDIRTLAFMVAVVGIAWLITSLPLAIVCSRRSVLSSLQLEGRSASGSRAGRWIRSGLTVGEMAATTGLLVGALLAGRSYTTLLGTPKGFDTYGVGVVSVTQRPGAAEKPKDLGPRILSSLRARPDVRYAAAAQGVPPSSGGGINGNLRVVGRDEPLGLVTVNSYGVDSQFFSAMRLPIVDGHAFSDSDQPEAVVIDEELAKKYWPGSSPVGDRITFGNPRFFRGTGVYEVVGVAKHMRTNYDPAVGTSEDTFALYYRLADDAALTFVLRFTDPSRLDDALAMVRTLATGDRVTGELITDRYAAMFSNEMIAASIMSVFSGLAFVVAIAGLYAVMAFLVASRTREIGIRVALGADRARIQRLVMGGSLALVATGAAIGGVAAFVGARWASSLLIGVSTTEPWTYAAVIGSVTIAALLATWQPARAAAAVDPTILLRD